MTSIISSSFLRHRKIEPFEVWYSNSRLGLIRYIFNQYWITYTLIGARRISFLFKEVAWMRESLSWANATASKMRSRCSKKVNAVWLRCFIVITKKGLAIGKEGARGRTKNGSEERNLASKFKRRPSLTAPNRWYGSCNNFLQLSFWLFSLNRHVGQVLVLLWTACKGRLERLGWSEDLDLCVFVWKWTKNVKWLLPKTFSDCFNCQNTLAKHLWCRRHFGNAWQNTWLKWECGLVCFANRKTDQWSSSYFSPKPCHVLSIAKTHWLNTCLAVDTLKSFAGNLDSRENSKTLMCVPCVWGGATKFQDLFPSSILALQITWTCFLTCCEPIVMVSWTWWKARAWDDLACFCPFPSNQSSKRKAVLEVPHVLLANLVTIMPCYAPTHGLVNDIVILHTTCLSGPLVKI